MNLYRMELYKILHKKIVIVTGILIIMWLGFYFCLLVSDEHTTIDGIDYYGYEAIQKNREITEEYKGTFTDEKAKQIIARYGFPHKVVKGWGYWQDSNYLNAFVTDYLSDGYIYGWEEGEYQIAQHVIPMQESELNIYLDAPLPFAYTKGWERLLDYMEMGALLLSAWLIIAFSTLFSEERQNNTRSLIFTTEKGFGQIAGAKIGAAFTLCLTAGFAFLGISCVLFESVFGLDGNNVPAAIASHRCGFNSLMYGRINHYVLKYIIIILAALVMLTAICLWISAKVKNNFQAILSNIMVWLLPCAVYLCIRGGVFRLVAGCLPFMLVMYDNMEELYALYNVQLWVIFAVVVLCSVSGSRDWRKVDLE